MITLEDALVRHCAPTLMGLKTGSLFNACRIDAASLDRQTADLRRKLAPLGLDIRLFYNQDKPALVYVYRPAQLAADLARPQAQDFMKAYGYTDFSCRAALARLAERLRDYRDGGFPHEIGLFLSYPLDDVKAFVQLGGACSKFAGYWCVYDHEDQARACFAAYDRCKEECLFRYQSGQSITDLARAV